MKRKSFRLWFVISFAGAVLLSSFTAPAGAAERSLLGIPIDANVKLVLRRFGNPNYVLTAGQAFNMQTSSVSGMGGGPPGQQGPANDYGLGRMQSAIQGYANQLNSAMDDQLPAMAPAGAPVSAYGQAQLPQNQGGPTTAAPPPMGEVTLVYQEPTGATYEFLLSTTGAVKQITALGYADVNARTSKAIHFGSTYTQLCAKYGFPEGQSETNGVRIVDFSKSSHVAFELVNNAVVGIVVASVGASPSSSSE